MFSSLRQKKSIAVLMAFAIVLASAFLFFPNAKAQIVDGTATATGNNVSSASMTLTTTKAPDVLLLAVSYSKPFFSVSSVSSSIALSTGFTHLATSSQGAVTVEVWYAVATSAVTSDTITVTMGGSEYFQASVFALVGPASTTSPFDGSVVTSSGNSNIASINVATTAQNDVVLGFAATWGSPSVNWLPYTGIVTSSGSGNTTVTSGDHETTTSATTVPVSVTFSSSNPWAMVGVAVQMLGASATDTFTLINPRVFWQANATPHDNFVLINPSIMTTPSASPHNNFALITPCMNMSVGGTLQLDTCQAIATVYGQTLTSSAVPVLYKFIGSNYAGSLTSSQTKFTVDQKSLFTVNSTVVWTISYNVSYIYVSQNEGFELFSNVSLSSIKDSSSELNFTCSACAVQVWVPPSLNAAPLKVLDNGVSIPFTYNGASGIMSFNAASPVEIVFLQGGSSGIGGGGGSGGGTPPSTCTINCNPQSTNQSGTTLPATAQPYVNIDAAKIVQTLKNPYFDLFLLIMILIILFATFYKRRNDPKRFWRSIKKQEKHLFG